MSGHLHKTIGVLLLSAGITLLVLYAFFYPALNESPVAQTGHAAEQSRSNTAKSPMEPAAANEATYISSDMDLPASVQLPESDIEYLFATGTIRNPYRWRNLDRMVNQTTEDTVKDLGNIFGNMNPLSRDFAYSMKDMGRWYDRVQLDLKTRRLIQTGRVIPSRVKPLVIDMIAESISHYTSVRDASEQLLGREKNGGAAPEPSSSEEYEFNNKYYLTHHRYPNPVFEFHRLYNSIYRGFYILANMDEMDQQTHELLRQWISIQKTPKANAREMDVWLIDRQMQSQFAASSGLASQYQNIIGHRQISGSTEYVNTWDWYWMEKDPSRKLPLEDSANPQKIKLLDIFMDIRLGDEEEDQILTWFTQIK